MKLRSLPVVLVALAILAAAMSAGCASKGGGGKDEIVIGEYGSLTGNDATFGQSTKAGVDVALADLLAKKGGKIGGLTVRAVVEDDQGKADEAATVVQKLINQDQVVAVIGEVASSRSLAAAPICQSAGVPMISPSSTNPKVTQAGDFIFRMCFLDDFQGQTMAKFAHVNLGLKKVAILKDVKSDYSVGLAQYFTDAFTKEGGTVIAEQAYSAGDQDFSAQLTAIKAKNPDAIFIPGYYTEVGLIARKARELGINVPLLGGDGWESEKLIEIGGDAMNGSYYSNHWALDKPDTTLQAFLKAYHDKFKAEPDAIGGLAYDAANVLFQCMERLATEDPATFAGLASSKAGTPERKAACAKLRELIAGTQGYNGVTGNITLDANRNASKPAVVIEVKGGKKVYNTTMNPS
jgi:branched-chain amino acid transport system substrate-binding protein